MNPQEIVVALSHKNAICEISDDPKYLHGIRELFPGWKHLYAFSTLEVIMRKNPWGDELFVENEKEYMGIFPRADILDINRHFRDVRFLVVGYSACGDYLVIDTFSEIQDIVGFIDHPSILEDELRFEDAYRSFDCSLQYLLLNMGMYFDSIKCERTGATD